MVNISSFYSSGQGVPLAKWISHEVGEIGEKVAVDYLRREGFKVMDFLVPPEIADGQERDSRGRFPRPWFYREELWSLLKPFLKDRYDSYVTLWRELGARYDGHPLGPASIDFLAKKRKEFYLVEVKTNTSVFLERQKKILLGASKYGFRTLILQVQLNVEPGITEIPVERLRHLPTKP